MRRFAPPSAVAAGGFGVTQPSQHRSNRDSFISTDSTTTYASTPSEQSFLTSTPSETTESTVLPTPPTSPRVRRISRKMYDDGYDGQHHHQPPPQSSARTPTRSAPASRHATPQRSAVIRHQPSRSEVREIRDPALAATPPRRDSGQDRNMVDKLDGERTITPQRAAAARDRLSQTQVYPQSQSRGQMPEKAREDKVMARASQAQLRTKASAPHLAQPRDRTSKHAGPTVAPASAPRERPTTRQSAQVERERPPAQPDFEGHRYSQANPPNVRTGTKQVAIPLRPPQTSAAPPAPATLAMAPASAARPRRLAAPGDPTRPTAGNVAGKSGGTSPAGSHASFAEEWEEQLIERAKNLRIPDVQPNAAAAYASQAVQLAHHGRRDETEEWERRGMAHETRLEGRDAEDRSRRDAQRQIAYPPSMLSQPIRAVASGVTSVHIGVRPRIHPSRSESSIAFNQPDTTLPEPLFSPLHSAGAAGMSPTASSPRTGGEGRYSAEKYAQAQKEYEDWLSRKAEREAGIGQPQDNSAGGTGAREDGFGRGSSSWQPREREPARFGYLYGAQEEYPANLGKGSHAHAQAHSPVEAQVQGGAQGQIGQQAYQQPQITNHAHVQDLKAQAQMQAQLGQMAQMGLGMGVDGQTMPSIQAHAGHTGAHSHLEHQDGMGMDMQGMYGGYGGWDPATYWWMVQQTQMAQMGMGGGMYDAMGNFIGAQGMGMQGIPGGMGMGNEVSPITSEDSSASGSSASEAVEQAPKVHFAPSPERDRTKPRRRRSMLGLNVPIAAQGAIQQEVINGSPAVQAHGQMPLQLRGYGQVQQLDAAALAEHT